MQGEGRRAAVVGGSLGGLTAANLLRDDGWDVVVYEKSAVPLDGRGAGIVVHASTVRYLLDRMHLDIESISCPSSVLRYLGPDGSVVHEQPSSYHLTAWNTLYRNLLVGVGEQRYRLGHALCGIAGGEDGGEDGGENGGENDGPVELQFANGVLDRADLVVAADGFDSTVRRLLFGAVEATYSGYVGWRGLVAESDLTPATFGLLADAITYCVIPSSHIVVYPIPNVDGSVRPGERLINYVWYRNVAAGADLEQLMTGTDGIARAASLPPGAVQARFVDEMKHAAAQLAPVLTEVVQRTPEPFLQVIQDIETPRMATSRVALLGDGAFSARPHAAAGTAKAAEDGWQLAAALRAYDTIPEALRYWEATQLQLGRQLVRRARDLGERSQFLNTWVPGDPELVFGLFGPGR